MILSYLRWDGMRDLKVSLILLMAKSVGRAATTSSRSCWYFSHLGLGCRILGECAPVWPYLAMV